MELAEAGINARLVAPRRYGKTSILGHVQKNLENRDWVTVSVDVLGVVTMSDLTRRVEAAYAQQLHGPLRKWFTGFVRTFTPTFGLGGGPSPGSASLRIAEAARLGLEERLAVPQRIYEKWGDRVHVVFDEFQDVLRVDGEPAAVIRSVIQHHGDAASYVFVGSELGMMEQIFDRSPAWPFQTAPVLLHQLESEDLGDYVRIRFERTGKEVAADALGAYLRVVEGHPQRAMLVAHHWWGATRRVGGVTELDTAIVTVTNQANGELTQLWSGLTAVDSRCVVAIATGVSPYSARIGPGGGAVQKSLARLEDQGVIARRRSNEWYLVDPLFAQWVVARTPTRFRTDDGTSSASWPHRAR